MKDAQITTPHDDAIKITLYGGVEDASGKPTMLFVGGTIGRDLSDGIELDGRLFHPNRDAEVAGPAEVRLDWEDSGEDSEAGGPFRAFGYEGGRTLVLER